jgi:hypothetical protein
MRRKSAPWMSQKLMWQGAKMALDAQFVIAMRVAQMGNNDAASRREAALMVNEKVAAFAKSQIIAMKAAQTGQSGEAVHRIMGLYGRKVAANRRRLSKG